MKAVVWTDALQGIIYAAGIITVLAIVSKSMKHYIELKTSGKLIKPTSLFTNINLSMQGTHKVGGIGNVWTVSKEKGRLDVWKYELL